MRARVCLIFLGQCTAQHSTVHQVSEFTRVTDNFVKVCFADQNLAVFCCTNIKLTLSNLSKLRLTGCREGHAAAEVQLRMMRDEADRTLGDSARLLMSCTNKGTRQKKNASLIPFFRLLYPENCFYRWN